MATRSTIALEFADGTVEQVYCHWDGYLENNGAILLEHYKDPFKLQKLIDLGALSVLAPRVETEGGHNFSKPVDGICVFYARDRGEDLVKNKFKDFADYKRNAQSEEYNYILRRDGKWYVEFYGEFDGLLSEAFEFQAAQEAA